LYTHKKKINYFFTERCIYQKENVEGGRLIRNHGIGKVCVCKILLQKGSGRKHRDVVQVEGFACSSKLVNSVPEMLSRQIHVVLKAFE